MRRRDILRVSGRIKKRRIIIRIILLFLIFVIVIAGIISFFYIPKLKIQKISIKSYSEKIDKDELSKYISNYLDKKYLGIFPLANFFLFPKNEVKLNILKDFPYVKEVTLDKNFPDTINLEIKEREPEAILCYENDCSFLDEDSFIFQKAPFFSGSTVVKFRDERSGSNRLFLGDKLLDNNQFKNLIKFKDLLKSEKIEVDEIILKDENIYNIVTSDNWRIIINNENNIDDTLINLKTIINSKIKDKIKNLEYIDLRFGNKVFYKLR